MPEEKIFTACQRQLNRCMEKWGYPIYSISQKPIDFGINTVMDLERSVLSMFKQILKGLEECKTDIVFLIEHDLLYHPSHFDFTPQKDDHFYFNQNFWNVSSVDGKAVYYIHNDVSMVCAYRSLLLRHYRKVVEWVEKMGHKRSWGFSPPKGLPKEERYGHYTNYRSVVPDINIRHPNAFTPQRMDKSEFRSERSRRGWTESDGVPGWGKTKGRFDEFLAQPK
ncbi:hypothetical protein HYT32_02020 [Candidatus Roizmanbacteria bacterium]|nr:hypothetical protein [Candidatus Roizmanbacteria bacterium]